jgi:hypothetical protein
MKHKESIKTLGNDNFNKNNALPNKKLNGKKSPSEEKAFAASIFYIEFAWRQTGNLNCLWVWFYAGIK